MVVSIPDLSLLTYFELIQIEAAKILTGTTKSVSVANLYTETYWETLDARRNKHKLVLFYKVLIALTPHHLSSIVSSLVQNASRYNLRNFNDTQDYRFSLYFILKFSSILNNSRLEPSKSWYENTDTLDSFKHKLNQNLSVIPIHYYTKIRKYQIRHSRIRTGCSSLKNDVFLKQYYWLSTMCLQSEMLVP